MKKILFVGIGLLAFCGAMQAQSVQIAIDAGLLENALGTTPVANGGLLQLIASPSGNFSAPTSTAYVTGDNVLVQSFAFATSGAAGETANTLSGLQLTTSSYTITPGESLTLRFYPSLTYAAAPSAPTLGTTYGQVRSNTIEFGPPIDSLETAWVVPAAGTSADLDYITVNDGGTYANNTAFATNVVLVGVSIPEPSTYVLALVALLALRLAVTRSKQIS